MNTFRKTASRYWEHTHLKQILVMKSVQSKILLTLVIVFFIIGFNTSAKSIIEFHNFFKPEPNPELTGEVNPLSVVYPVSLQDYRFQTKEYIKTFSEKKRAYIIDIFTKGKKYFPKAIEVLDQYNVPQEIQMIPLLESEFNANAVSPVGAIGYWQFMSELAKEYGLRTGGKHDERRNFSKSTVAAARFFRDQLDYFDDDILLAVAAYNCGQGRVISSIKKTRKADATFWDIKKYLPFETRRFVMNFIAFNVVAANYDKFLNRELNFNESVLLPVVATITTDSTTVKDSMFIKPL
jgi:hypothetical protein